MRLIFGFLFFTLILFTDNFCQEVTINDIKESLETFNYESVVDLSNQLLTSYDSLSEVDLINILTMKAVAHYSLGQESGARMTFLEILKINKDYILNPVEISPKIISFFDQVKFEYESLLVEESEIEEIPSDTLNLSEPVILQVEKNVIINAVSRSMLLPGLGQLYLESNTGGWLLSSISALTLGSMVYYIFDADYKEKNYLKQNDPILIERKYDKYNTSYKIRNALIISYAALWIYSQLDILFFSEDQISNKINTILLADIFNSDEIRIEVALKIEL